MAFMLLLASALQVATSPAPLAVHADVSMPTSVAGSNRAVVDQAFADWQANRGSFYDLIAADGFITIAGQSPHSGTFGKATFLRDRAKPFQARFSTPIVPTRWKVWAVDDQVFVRWDSKATACDGRPYINSYAYFITMRDGRATALTMFLDMGAFDDVWNRCRPADQNTGSGR